MQRLKHLSQHRRLKLQAKLRNLMTKSRKDRPDPTVLERLYGEDAPARARKQQREVDGGVQDGWGGVKMKKSRLKNQNPAGPVNRD